MTAEELKQYKKEYNAKIASLRSEHEKFNTMIASIKKKQSAITFKVHDLIDNHEKVCEEFDRENKVIE